MSSSTWDLIHAERRQLIEDLEPLTAEQWQTRSLCPEWNLQQMLAHLVALTKQTPPKFVRQVRGVGLSVQQDGGQGRRSGECWNPAQTLAEFVAHQDDTSAPPGPVDSWIGEIVVHGADIRRPLGIAYSPPVATTRQVADFYKNSNLLIGAKGRIVGVRMVATDTDWTHGSGPEVQGPILSLVQAMTGRAVALADLTGDGVQTLTARMPAP